MNKFILCLLFLMALIVRADSQTITLPGGSLWASNNPNYFGGQDLIVYTRTKSTWADLISNLPPATPLMDPGASNNQVDEARAAWSNSNKWLVCASDRTGQFSQYMAVRCRYLDNTATPLGPEFTASLGFQTEFRPLPSSYGYDKWLIGYTEGWTYRARVALVEYPTGTIMDTQVSPLGTGVDYSMGNAVPVGYPGVVMAIYAKYEAPIKVVGRLLDPATGQLLSAETPLFPTSNDQKEPFGCQDGLGGVVIIWSEATSGYQLQVARFGRNMNLLYGPVQPAAGLGGRNWGGQGCARMLDGRFVVVWDRRTGPGSNIQSEGWYVILDQGLNTVVRAKFYGPVPAGLNGTTPDGQSPPSVSVGPDGTIRAGMNDTIVTIPIP